MQHLLHRSTGIKNLLLPSNGTQQRTHASQLVQQMIQSLFGICQSSQMRKRDRCKVDERIRLRTYHLNYSSSIKARRKLRNFTGILKYPVWSLLQAWITSASSRPSLCKTLSHPVDSVCSRIDHVIHAKKGLLLKDASIGC